LRVLDPGRALVKLDELGLDDADRELLERTLKLGHGAILATGPTGSGKTTTLYAALNLLNEPERTIVTIEDPVEYEIDGIKQVPVNVKAGLTFARGLRAIVRADPDVVMVGEIRDRETAQIAIEAALTGHLVLSTLHANDSATAAARLIDMGVEPFLVASSLECVIAQRLARRLCDCKQPLRLTRKVLRENGFGQVGPIDAFAPGGCVRCAGTGFRGRVGIYEMLRFDDELRALVLERASADRIRRAARQGGLRALREAALDKVRAGVTSLDEVLRALGTAA
ncbi:MAG: GspE/PulE family protein, partial [Thermoleophilum sp.]|nr:GspE/PulE family protein [Thermoleophilum sp.]